MSINVLKATSVHPPMVLWLSRFHASGCYGLVYHLIYFFSTFCGQCHYHFCIFCGIANFLFSKSFKKFFNQQHNENIFTNNHACCICISKLRVEPKTKFSKEPYCLIEIFYWQIYKNFCSNCIRIKIEDYKCFELSEVRNG